jgi:hypothetical protein
MPAPEAITTAPWSKLRLLNVVDAEYGLSPRQRLCEIATEEAQYRNPAELSKPGAYAIHHKISNPARHHRWGRCTPAMGPVHTSAGVIEFAEESGSAPHVGPVHTSADAVESTHEPCAAPHAVPVHIAAGAVEPAAASDGVL